MVQAVVVTGFSPSVAPREHEREAFDFAAEQRWPPVLPCAWSQSRHSPDIFEREAGCRELK